MIRPALVRPLYSHFRSASSFQHAARRTPPSFHLRHSYTTRPEFSSTQSSRSTNDASVPKPSPSQSAPSTNNPPEHSTQASELPERPSHSSLDRPSPFSHFSDAPRLHSGSLRDAEVDDVVSRISLRLREWATKAAIQTRLRTDDLVPRLTRFLSHAGGEINRVTGYEQIDALKRRVIEREEHMAATRTAAREAKVAFEDAVRRRSASQKEVNDLLQRKSMWTEMDVGRFTELVRADHALEQAEVRARQAAEEAEESVEREFTAFMRAILDRYHEEQVWSDKIRSVSTYGSLAVVAVNLLVFVLAIIIIEPWKRRRLAQTFERKVEELEREHLAVTTAAVGRLEKKFEAQDELLGHLVAVATARATPPEPEIAAGTPAMIPGDKPTSLEFFAWSWSEAEERRLLFAVNIAAIGAAAVLSALAWIHK